MSANPNLTVFYDGACPLCRAEIGFYRRRRGADVVAWIDISRTMEEEAAPGLSCEAALRRFHVVHADGRIASGGRAFADLWSVLPAMAWAGALFKLWPFSVLLEAAYRLFLPLRPRLQRLAALRG